MRKSLIDQCYVTAVESKYGISGCCFYRTFPPRLEKEVLPCFTIIFIQNAHNISLESALLFELQSIMRSPEKPFLVPAATLALFCAIQFFNQAWKFQEDFLTLVTFHLQAEKCLPCPLQHQSVAQLWLLPTNNFSQKISVQFFLWRWRLLEFRAYLTGVLVTFPHSRWSDEAQVGERHDKNDKKFHSRVPKKGTCIWGKPLFEKWFVQMGIARCGVGPLGPLELALKPTSVSSINWPRSNFCFYAHLS